MNYKFVRHLKYSILHTSGTRNFAIMLSQRPYGRPHTYSHIYEDFSPAAVMIKNLDLYSSI